jgi:cytochrome b561
MNTTKRYNPIMVVLHWLTVLLLLGAGLLADGEGGGSSPIDIHMILGALLLFVMVVRLILRFTLQRPAWANTGIQFLNKLGELVHIGLYLFVFVILAFGAYLATQRNLFAYALGTGSVLHGRGGLYGAFHQLGWLAVVLLLLLHIGGAFYHQFIIKDNLLDRMWFGRQ